MRVVLIILLVAVLVLVAYKLLKPPEKSDLEKICESGAKSGGYDPALCKTAAALAKPAVDAGGAVADTLLKDGEPICGFDSVLAFADDPAGFDGEEFCNGKAARGGAGLFSRWTSAGAATGRKVAAIGKQAST